jgi:hypothetical protein
MPGALTLHLILDNYATASIAKVRRWTLAATPATGRQHARERLMLHFTPSVSSWLNLVRALLPRPHRIRDLTADVVREGSFASGRGLISAIESYLAERNLAPKRHV